MRSWQKLQKDRRIDRQIAADTNRPKRCKCSDGSEIRAAGCCHAEHSGDANGEIERPSSSENVAAKAPEHGTEEQPDVLGERQERPAVGLEFILHGREDQRSYNRP